MLNIVDLHKSYFLGHVKVDILKGINLSIQNGEMVSIVGPSGCGKSTLMNILGFLDTPTSGKYFFEEKETSCMSDKALSSIRNQKIGFVFQQFHLIRRMTAIDNVCLPLIYRGIKKKQRLQIAAEVLERVGMSERMHHKPSELSGGQQQRIAIARAICTKPSVILADEPTGALDTNTSKEIMELFMELNHQEGITLIIITHDPSIAKQCRLMVRIKDGRLC
ncbi:MAG: ABC transporter ATP-binding protein [Desulfobacterales bacterium]|nr:ABC transporter ATP-binding protein [Desulfobacterales bacterium]